MTNQKITADIVSMTPAVRGGATIAQSGDIEDDNLEDGNLEDGNLEDTRKDVKIISLSLDDNDDGVDPYNHTGSHCILDFDEND